MRLSLTCRFALLFVLLSFFSPFISALTIDDIDPFYELSTAERSRIIVALGLDQSGKSLPDDFFGILGHRFEDRNDILLVFSDRIEDFQYDPELIEITPNVKFRLQHRYNCYYCLSSSDFRPGGIYSITFKAGFPGKHSKARLENDYTLNLACPDLPPRMKFASQGTFFPLHAPIWELPLEATNITEKAQCTVYEAYPATLLNYLRRLGGYYEEGERWTHKISSQKIEIPYIENEKLASSLDLAQVGIPRDRPGLYVIEIENPHRRSYYSNEIRHIVVTDLSLFLTAASGEYLCQVRSLEHPEQEIPGVQLELYSRKFQCLAKGVTDSHGEARLRVLPQEDEDDSPMLLLARNPKDNDVSYLDFDWSHVNQNGKMTSVQDAKAPQGCLFGDRGAVLPGEEVTFTALLRNPAENRPFANLPLEFTLLDPRHNTVTTQMVTTDEFGVLQVAAKLSNQAPLGYYTAALRQPGDKISIAKTGILVANFVPDQLTARIELPDQISQQSLVDVSVQSNYYFGPPVKNTAVTLNASCAWYTIAPPDHLRDFLFGHLENDYYIPKQNQELRGTTDAQGKVAFQLDLPELEKNEYLPALPLKVTVQATVNPAGARPVTAHAISRYDTFPYCLGSRVLKEEGNRIQLQFVALDNQNRETALPESLTVAVQKVTWEYLLRQQDDDTYRREWQKVLTDVGSPTVQPDADGCAWVELPEYGSYSLSIRTPEGRLLNEMPCWHYYSETGERSPSPSRLTFTLDASQYRPGQTAHLSFESDFAGTCLVVCGSHHTPLRTASQPLEVGVNTIDIDIPEGLCQTRWHVGVTAVGAFEVDANGTPQDPPYLSGIAVIDIDQSANRLAISVDAPSQAHPGEEVGFAVTLKDSDGNPVSGEVSLWAVDEGILALTGYSTPDAFLSFFGDPECPFELANLYPRLYPMLRVVNGKIGGGAYASADKAADFQGRLANDQEPRHFVQLGLFRSDEAGCIKTTLPLPGFAGTVRLMAVATDATTHLGCAQKDIVMHDEVTITMVAPRVIAPGDTMLLRATIFNHDLENAHLKWSAGRELEGFRPATGEVTLAKGDSADISTQLAIPEDTAEGALPILLTVETDDGRRYEKRTTITVRSVLPPQPICDTRLLQPGEELVFELSGQATDLVRIGSPVIRLLRHWEWLNDYPHGCIEQITATAFPQLAIPDLIASGRLPDHLRAGARQVVGETLDRFYAYRTANHWYSMWPNGTEPWEAGSLFAFLFQAESVRAGFPIATRQRRQLTQTLRLFINDRTKDQVERALALYTLSLLSPTYVKEYAQLLPLGEESCQPFTAFLAAMALIRGGFSAEGIELWQQISDKEFTRAPAESYSLDSAVRRTGLALWLLSDLLPEDPRNLQLANTLDSLAQNDAYFTTQEHAWYALGLSRYLLTLPTQGESSFAAVLTSADGIAKELEFGGDTPIEVTQKGTYTVWNTGTEPLSVMHACRKKVDTAQDIAAGLQISRAYLAKDGSPVTSCRVGDLLTVHILLSGGAAEHLVISDLLPAGLEIEDEKLLTRYNLPIRNSKKSSVELTARLIEKRFDRLLWFGDFEGSTMPRQITYQVRAVTPGVFQIPPAQVEAMYQPQLRAVTMPKTPAFVIEE